MTRHATATLPPVTDETRGQQFANRREALRMSVRQLHEATGIARGTIAKIEHDDPSVEDFTVERLARELDRLERRHGIENPDQVLQVVELPDGTRVTHTGSPAGVAEAAARFLAERAGQPDPGIDP